MSIKNKKFLKRFILWVSIIAASLVAKSFQNDTFYSLKIGKLILDNGIDMMDHFSFHSNLSYTYPHWLYDVFIYLVYKVGKFKFIYISSILLLILLLILVLKINLKTCNNYSVAVFATFICCLAISSFVTARAQLISYLLFASEILFIETFLKSGKKKYLIGLILISLLLCNIHVAVWPFYFILYLPYLVEYLCSSLCQKWFKKKNNKLTSFLDKKIIFEKNKNIKLLFYTMLFSLLTGFFTPIGTTPWTYLIKTMLGNSQDYIIEHQMISWDRSPFPIMIAGETIFLMLISKVKLRDLFMVSGVTLMAVSSIRHIALLALLGTISLARTFNLFMENFNYNVDDKIINFFEKKIVIVISFIVACVFSFFMFRMQLRKDYVDKELYPVEAVNFIKKNIDIDNMRLYNDYDFGSYLLYNDIPVFIDSRADLYTKQFSGLDYDIFDDYENMCSIYSEKFNFYKITHVLVYKVGQLDDLLMKDINYKILYEDDNFILFEKLDNPLVSISYEN